MLKYCQRLLLLLTLLCSLTAAMAQKSFNAEAFETELVNYVVQQAHLTQDEARRFVPVYKEMVAKKRVLHDDLRKLRHQQTGSEQAARRLIERADNLEIRMRQLEQSYHQRMLKVITAVKLKAVLDAERKFHRMKFRKAAGKSR